MEASRVMDYAKNVEDTVIKWRRDLHQIPELGLELPKTVAYVKNILDSLGVSYEDHFVQGNAIVATIVGKKQGGNSRVIGLRADMDALPIQEETNLSFASKNGCMHACGHDGHTAILLGVVKFLQEHRHEFTGTVKFLFQPGEEYPGGAQPMIDEGALENPAVERVIGFHIGLLDPNMAPGMVGYKAGPMMASMDRFFVKIKGKGYHGAYPENSHDPIVAAGQLITALQTIKSRNIKAVNPAVLSITRVQGGFNQNIIPDTVELEGTVRTFDNELRKFIHQKIGQISSGISSACDVECEVVYDYKYPPLINDERVTRETVDSIKKLMDEAYVVELKEPLMSGEDFASYAQAVPSSFLYLSNPGLIEGAFHGHHHPKFDIDETLFHLAIGSFIQVTLDFLDSAGDAGFL